MTIFSSTALSKCATALASLQPAPPSLQEGVRRTGRAQGEGRKRKGFRGVEGVGNGDVQGEHKEFIQGEHGKAASGCECAPVCVCVSE